MDWWVIAPGHDLHMRWEQHNAEGTLSIKVVDPMSVFAFCWGISDAPAGDPRRTYVEGWRSELDELMAYLDAA